MSIVIPIISEFQNKGFKDAQKQTSLLDKSLKRLGVTLAATFSARKITQFTKQSIDAFIKEDKAVKALARNLSNLGLAYDVRPIEDYITKLSRATSIADDELRPAFQQLIQATKSLGASQELLNLALDVSAGTGKSLSSVVQALSRAYLGNNTSLTRLNIGLSKAELTSKSFSEITDELTKRFSGQAAAAADTYAGKMAILSNAANNAQEILGEKLMKSVEMLIDPDKGVPALADSFEKLATDIGNAVVGLSKFISLYKEIPGLGGTNIGFGDVLRGGLRAMFPQFMIPFQGAQRLGEAEAEKQRRKEDMIARANAKESGILRARAVRDEKTITSEKTKQNKLDKDKLKLETAGKMFDDELISLEAALKNESLDRNEILRLQLKKALINENADRATKLAEELTKSQSELAKLQNVKLTNPFDAWLESLQRIQEGLGRLTNPPSGSHGGSLVSPDLQGITKGTPYTPYDPGFKFEMPQWDWGATGGGILPMPTNNGVVVNMNISNLNGDLPEAVKEQIVQTVVEASGAGIATGWYRTTNRVAI